MAVPAKLIAEMRLNASQFRAEMARAVRSTDGAERRLESFGGRVRSIGTLMKVALGAQVVAQITRAMNAVKSFQADTGITLIPDAEIDKLERTQTLIRGIGAALGAAALKAVSFVIPDPARFDPNKQLEGFNAPTKTEAKEIAGVKEEIDRKKRAAMSAAQVYDEEVKKLKQLEALNASIRGHASRVAEIEKAALDVENQRLTVAEAKRKVEEEAARAQKDRDAETHAAAQKQLRDIEEKQRAEDEARKTAEAARTEEESKRQQLVELTETPAQKVARLRKEAGAPPPVEKPQAQRQPPAPPQPRGTEPQPQPPAPTPADKLDEEIKRAQARKELEAIEQRKARELESVDKQITAKRDDMRTIGEGIRPRNMESLQSVGGTVSANPFLAGQLRMSEAREAVTLARAQLKELEQMRKAIEGDF